MDIEATRAAVKRKAGPAVYSRGRRYYLGNRVSDVREVDGALVATVHGTEDYKVRVAEAAASWSCTCPYDHLCKHVVAVVLKATGEGTGAAGPEADLAGRIERAAGMLRSARRRSDVGPVVGRIAGLLSEAQKRDPVEAEGLLRRAMVLLRGTPAEDEALSRWTASLAATLPPDGAAGILVEVIREGPERALPALASGRFGPSDAAALLDALEGVTDPSVRDMAAAARTHLLGLLGRTDEVLEGLTPDMPAEAVAEACSLIGESRPEECRDLVLRAMEGRTPRETFVLRLALADLARGKGDERAHLLACVAISPDPAVVRRLVDVDADAAVSAPSLAGGDGAAALAEALAGAGRVPMARDVALRSGDPDLLEWAIDETGWGEVEPVERLIDLLLAAPGGKVLWRVRARLEGLRGTDGFAGLLSRLRERYPRRPALLRMLDELGGGGPSPDDGEGIQGQAQRCP